MLKQGSPTHQKVSMHYLSGLTPYIRKMGILITGATGNVGRAVLDHLPIQGSTQTIYAGVRNVESAKKKLKHFTEMQFRTFDFQNSATFQTAFEAVETLFLLRPPHIADVAAVFEPMMKTAKLMGIKNVVFLSVQGADQSSWIPHHKIEKLILDLDFQYVFLRPGYFMQNLTTTLYAEIESNNTITLPAGNAKFNWVDVKDIGAVAATVIQNIDVHQNKIYTLTGSKNLSFAEVVARINQKLETDIEYKSVNPISFFIKKKQEGVPTAMVIVLIVLHFLPRFQKEPEIHNDIFIVLSRKPINLDSFLKREKHHFQLNNESTRIKNTAGTDRFGF